MKKSISFFLLLALSISAAGQAPQEIAALISRDSLVKTVRILSGEEPVMIGGTSTLITTRSNSYPAMNDKAADYIRQRLVRYNLNVEDQYFSSAGRNVIATQTGNGRPDSIFIICAHYDAVANYCADDNASGVAAVLETARVLSAFSFRYTIIYILFDQEEIGYVGSQYYANRAYSQGYKISGVLNIDMIGYDSNNDRKFEIHTNYLSGSQVLKDAMVSTVGMNGLSLVPQVVNPGATNSDHANFWNNNYGAVALTELFFGGDGNPYYHTSRDRISVFNLDYFVELSKLAALTTARQAKSPSAVTYYTLTATAGTGGTISPAGSIQVTGGSNQTFTITPSVGYSIAGVTVDGTPAGPVASYTFTNITGNHTISASFTPVTYSITASAGAGGTISPSGTVTVNSGSNRTFTITPSAGYAIAGVTVDGTPAGPVASYTFTNITANHTINASFTPVTYNITASAGAGGTISPSGTVTVNRGTNQTFTITPSAGYAIAGVTVDGTPAGAVTSYTFNNVTANHTISASFSPVVVTWSITASAGTGGTISPSGTVTVNNGSNQTFTITPASGYAVSGVTVDGTPAGAVTSYTFNNVTASHTISASFSPVVVTWSITASAGTGGTITPSGTVTVNSGSSQTFTITPSAGYEIADVTVDGVSAGALQSYTFTNVTAAHTIAASFRALPVVTYRITVNVSGSGTITPSGTVTVNSGSDQTFTITPSPGWEIEDVFVDGMSMGSVSAYTFSNVTANHGISAVFAELPAEFPITASAGSGGSINPSGVVTAAAGSKASFTITPDPGFRIADVLVDGISAGPVPLYEFAGISSAHTITAEFTVAENIALNKPASSQSYYRNYQPSKANDDDATNSSYWAANWYPQWWKVDLGACYDINGIIIRNYSDGRRYYYYTIEASTDDVNYFPVAVKSDDNPATDTGDSYQVAVLARYLRVNVTYNSARSGVHISDFRVYGTVRTGVIQTLSGRGGSISPAGPVIPEKGFDQAFTIIPAVGFKIDDVIVDGQSVGPVPVYEFFGVTADHTIEAKFAPLISLALNKPTKSQSDFSPWYSSRNANDRFSSNSSRWSAYPYPQWWKVDLRGVYDINGIVVRNYVFANRYYNYTIEASFDDINYFPVTAKTDNKPSTDEGDSHTVNTSARYLKITIDYCSGAKGVHLSDFRVYGRLKAGAKEGEATTFLPDAAPVPASNDFSVDLYPTPFTDLFMVRINSPDEELYDISIVDFSGSTRFRQKDVPGNTELEFSPELEKGVYVLQVKSRKNLEALRLVKL